MVKVRFSVTSGTSAEAILAAATDFSTRRPELWPNIDPARYRVLWLGQSTAEAIEGSDVMGGIWARERYDWSTPGMVKAEVQESNVYRPGSSWQLVATPTPGGGSTVDVEVVRYPTGVKGRLIGLMLRLKGRALLTDSLQETLATLEREVMQAG